MGGGTENHLMLIDLTPFGPGRGCFIQLALDAARITVNKNTIPRDPSVPFYPSGIRLGTPAITSRGMKEKKIHVIAGFIARVVQEFSHVALPEEKSERAVAVREFTEKLFRSPFVKKLGDEVKRFVSKFPVPGI